MADQTQVQLEDVAPVRSRISWGAILAGAMLALGVSLILSLLGAAIGLSVGDTTRGETLAVGAAIWAVLTTVAALFAGGCVASQLSVGENKKEAMMYGLILWGVVFAMFLWLVASGVRGGFNALMGMTMAASGTTANDWEAAAQRAGVPQERLAEMRRAARDTAESAREGVNDPTNREAVREGAMQASWWTLLGTLLSMGAAVGGALMGAGPTLRLRSTATTGVTVARDGVRETAATR